MKNLKKGQKVKWKWGKGTAYGKVSLIKKSKLTISSKDSKITRNGSKENPAVKIKQDDGTTVIKKSSELKV